MIGSASLASVGAAVATGLICERGKSPQKRAACSPISTTAIQGLSRDSL